MTASPSNDAAGADHSLLPLKALYALYFGGLGIYFTFINVYYRSIGLSGAQIGLLNTVAPLVGLFAGTVWGLLSDRFGRTRLLLMVATVGLIASTLLLATVQSFAALVLPVALFSLFNSAIVPLVDSVTLATLGEHRERYGAQRIWGSIGFIITSSLSGFLVDALGIRVIFIGFALALGLHVLVLRWLPERSIELRGSILRGLPALVRQPAWLLFMVSVTLIATAGYAMGAFLSLTVKTLGGSDALVGLAWTIAALSELPIMAGSAWLLSKVGPARLLTIAFLVYSVRMFLYSVVQVPESVLLINLVGGMSFGLYWVSGVTYANQLAPPGLKATGQGMLTTVSNLAGMVGAAVGGWLFDLSGPSGLFRVMSFVCLTALIVFTAGPLWLRRRSVLRAAHHRADKLLDSSGR